MAADPVSDTTRTPTSLPAGSRIGAWTPRPDRHLDPARRRGDRRLGVALVVLWAGWLALTVLTAPRWVSVDQMNRDIVAGRVVAFDDAILLAPDDRQGWTDAPTVAVGRTSSSHRAVVTYLVDGPFATTRVLEQPTDRSAVVRSLESAGVGRISALPDPWSAIDTRQGWPLWAGVPLVGLFLASVVMGPGHTRGTRWFWFWTMFLTAGLGVLAYAVTELVRPGRPTPRPRLTGWVGFLAMVFAGPLVASLLSLPSTTTGWVGFLRF